MEGDKMTSLDSLTVRERSAYDLIGDGLSYGITAKLMEVTRSSVQVWIKRAKKKLYDKTYNIGDSDSEQSKSEIPLPQHAFKDPKTLENWTVVQKGGYFERVSWIPSPYALEDWRIDASLIPTTCSHCSPRNGPHVPLHSHWQGQAAWCDRCGRWFDRYDVGKTDEV